MDTREKVKQKKLVPHFGVLRAAWDGVYQSMLGGASLDGKAPLEVKDETALDDYLRAVAAVAPKSSQACETFAVDHARAFEAIRWRFARPHKTEIEEVISTARQVDRQLKFLFNEKNRAQFLLVGERDLLRLFWCDLDNNPGPAQTGAFVAFANKLEERLRKTPLKQGEGISEYEAYTTARLYKLFRGRTAGRRPVGKDHGKEVAPRDAMGLVQKAYEVFGVAVTPKQIERRIKLAKRL